MKTIELEIRMGNLKGNWFEWSCVRNEPDGTQTEGTVQADGQGEMVAEDTFEPE